MRKAGGKGESLSRPMSKLFPLEVLSRYGKQKENGEEWTDIKSVKFIGQMNPGSATTPTGTGSSRAAAEDS